VSTFYSAFWLKYVACEREHSSHEPALRSLCGACKHYGPARSITDGSTLLGAWPGRDQRRADEARPAGTMRGSIEQRVDVGREDRLGPGAPVSYDVGEWHQSDHPCHPTKLPALLRPPAKDRVSDRSRSPGAQGPSCRRGRGGWGERRIVRNGHASRGGARSAGAASDGPRGPRRRCATAASYSATSSEQWVWHSSGSHESSAGSGRFAFYCCLCAMRRPR
jgi:hypothetical protein